MAWGCEATLCAKCSQDSPGAIGAACLQRDRRLWSRRDSGCVFGFPSYMIALAVKCSPEKGRRRRHHGRKHWNWRGDCASAR